MPFILGEPAAMILGLTMRPHEATATELLELGPLGVRLVLRSTTLDSNMHPGWLTRLRIEIKLTRLRILIINLISSQVQP